MMINITCPIFVEGHFVTEFDACVEIRVTSRPKPVTYFSPAEGAEWEIEDVYVAPYLERHPRHYLKAPGCLRGFVEDYLASKEGNNTMQEFVSDALLGGER